MEIVILNSDNCKEYSIEELETLLGLDNEWESGIEEKNDDDFWENIDYIDFEAMFNTMDEGRYSTKQAFENAAIIRMNNERIEKLKTEVEKLKAERKVWEDKIYKKSKGSVFVGDELNGNEYSFNYINERRRKNKVNLYNEYIRDIENEIKKLSQ
jgi:cell division protein FtsB